jgi:hypothetical protein
VLSNLLIELDSGQLFAILWRILLKSNRHGDGGLLVPFITFVAFLSGLFLFDFGGLFVCTPFVDILKGKFAYFTPKYSWVGSNY